MSRILFVIGCIVTILTLYILLKNIGTDFYDLLLFRKKKKLNIYQKIKIWYDYIDSNLSSNKLSFDKINNLETEVDLLFSKKTNKHLTISFRKGFRKNILSELGIKKDFKSDKELFKSHAGLNLEKSEFALKLYEYAHKRKYSLTKYPFENYWSTIRGNFYIFYSQYKDNWKNLKDEKEKFTWADVEVPFRILRRYFND